MNHPRLAGAPREAQPATGYSVGLLVFRVVPSALTVATRSPPVASRNLAKNLATPARSQTWRNASVGVSG